MTLVHPSGRVSEEDAGDNGNIFDRVNLDLTSQRFNWRRGTFEGPGSLSLLAQIMIQLALCALAIGIPWAVYAWNFVAKPYPLLAATPPTTPHPPLELIRWALFLAIAYSAFVLVNVIAFVTVLLVHWSFKARQRDTPRQIQRIGDRLLVLRLYAARLASGLALLFVASILFPLSEQESQMDLFSMQSIKSDKKATVAETAQAVTSIAYAQNLRAYGQGHSFEFFVNRGAAAIVVIFGAIFVERIIIQHIAVTFYYRSFGKRLSDNDFGLKATRRLISAVVEGHPELEGKEPVDVLFDGLRPRGADVLRVSEFGTVLAAPEAERYFQLMDLETTGEITRAQLARSLAQLHLEGDTLRAGMHEQAQIIGKLNGIFMFFTWILIWIISIALFQVSIRAVVAALASIGAIVMFLSTGTLKTAVESILFVIFTHPFDVGDRVMVRNDFYVVKELGLWTTTFIGPGNRITYIANSKLRGEMIINTRRSPFQSENIIFNILPTTPTELISKLEGRILQFYKQNPRDYIPTVLLGGYTILNKDNMRMALQLLHRGNFQNMELKDMRTSKFILFLKDAIAECGISLSPPPPLLKP